MPHFPLTTMSTALLLQVGKKEQGKDMLLKEIALYPESQLFIERILKMIEK